MLPEWIEHSTSPLQKGVPLSGVKRYEFAGR